MLVDNRRCLVQVAATHAPSVPGREAVPKPGARSCARLPPQYSLDVQFEPRLRTGIRDGTITLAFRRWRRPQVVAGHQYRTGAGLAFAETVDVITTADITAVQARDAASPRSRRSSATCAVIPPCRSTGSGSGRWTAPIRGTSSRPPPR